MSAPTQSRRSRRAARVEEPTAPQWPPVEASAPGGQVQPVPFARPRPAGPVGWIGIVLALVVLGVAVVLVHDGLVRLGTLAGRPWLLDAADAVGEVRPTWQVALVGAVVGLLGLWLVALALSRRSRPGIALAAGGGQYLLGQDVARLASGAAAQVDGVLDATSTWRPRTVTVRATTDGGQGVDEQVRAAVAERLGALASVPRVVVRSRRSRDDEAGAR